MRATLLIILLSGTGWTQQPTDPAPRAAAGDEAAALLQQANTAKRKRDYEGAVKLLDRCVKVQASSSGCYLALGSAWASIASRDSSAEAMARARANYQRYLEVAPPDDAYRSKVVAILDAAR